VAVSRRVEDVHGSGVDVAHAASTAGTRGDDAWVRRRRTVGRYQARTVVGIARVVRVASVPVNMARVCFVGHGVARVALASSLAHGLRRVRRVSTSEASVIGHRALTVQRAINRACSATLGTALAVAGAAADVMPCVKMTASAERRSAVAHDVFIPDRVAAAAEPRD
jgi:hypothetical protein